MSEAGAEMRARRRAAVSHIITDALCEHNLKRKDELMLAIIHLKRAYEGDSSLDDLFGFILDVGKGADK